MNTGWKKLAALAAGVLCLIWMGRGTVLAAEAAQAQTAQNGVIQAEEDAVTPMTAAMIATQQAVVRQRPDAGDSLGQLQPGQVANVCGMAENGWYQIVYGKGIGYVSGGMMAQVPVDATMLDALAQQAQLVKQQLAQQAALQEARAQNAVPGSGNLIFVGDSRTGQMGNAVGGPAAWPGTAFVACYGGGVDWLSTPQAKKEIDQYVTPGSTIVINYGVNDLSRHNDYIATINRYSQDWMERGAAVYFATVGPVGENQYGKRNWAVEYFNNQLTGRLSGGIGRIDLYGYLTAVGYQTTSDGLHYTPATYAAAFQFLMQSTGRA